MKKTKLLENNKAILYKFYSEEDYYYIVTRLNFNKAGKRKSMRFKTYEDAKKRFLQINYM